MKRSILVVAVVSLMALTISCGEEGEPADGGAVTVTDAWARSPMSDKGAVYFVVTNDGTEADRLVGAAAPDLDAMVGIHETVMSEGVAEMQPVDGVDIPAGGAVTFEPGGYHVMLEELTEPLEVGSTISIVLTFEQAGDVSVDAEIRAFVEEDGGM
ncbi:MAG TPA: copper chaperone PCu(A)C [Actinomycetota bacterium]